MTGLLLLVAGAAVVVIIPRPDASTPAASVQPSDATLPPLTTAPGGQSGGMLPDGGTGGTAAPETTRPLDLPEPVGGVSPDWPEWVLVSNEEPGSTSYSATLTVAEGGADRVLVWLSTQNWVATGSGMDATVWNLQAGDGSNYRGTLVVKDATTFVISISAG